LKIKLNIFFCLSFLLAVSLACNSKTKIGDKPIDGLELTNHLKKEVVTFVYHRFGNSKYPSTNISLEDFEKHLNYLKSNNFTILTFGKAVEYINNPQIPFIKNVVCITIDDGYKTFTSNAMPMLEKYGYKATLFINSESVGGGSFMSWEELKEVSDSGIEIGNHSHSHAYFLNTPGSERIDFFKEDLEECQEQINRHLGFYPKVFAYPYGEFDPEMKEVLKDLGFKAAAAQNSGVMYDHDIFAIPRFPMAGPYTEIEGFREKANMKALRIKSKQPESNLLNGDNPPTITIEFDSIGADLSRHNCFTAGDCATTLIDNSLSIKANGKLNSRRTLYTITAPSKEGKEWYWFSHLWIQPNLKE